MAKAFKIRADKGRSTVPSPSSGTVQLTRLGLEGVRSGLLTKESLNLPGKTKVYVIYDQERDLYKIGKSFIPILTREKLSKELGRDVELLAVGIMMKNRHRVYDWFRDQKRKHPDIRHENSMSGDQGWIPNSSKLVNLINQLNDDMLFLEENGSAVINEMVDP